MQKNFYARHSKEPWKDKQKDSCVLCLFFTVFKLFPGNSIISIMLQRDAGERPMESPPSEGFEGRRTVLKGEKSDAAKIDFRGQILILVILVWVDVHRGNRAPRQWWTVLIELRSDYITFKQAMDNFKANLKKQPVLLYWD